MGRTKTAITIRDVAKEAGVSVSTVSRVLNDKDDVAPETYERVQRVIQEMGYTSSLAARSMRSRRTNVIGLIVPDVTDSFSIEVMRGVNQAIFELGYDLIIYTSGSIKKRSAAEQERHFVSLLNGSVTDGVIIVTPAATSFSTAAPVVTIGPNNECPECLTILATNRAGALAAMEYLIGLGHRRIGFISGRPDLQSAEQRRLGYQEALRQAEIPLDPELIATGDFSIETGRLCARNLLSRPGLEARVVVDHRLYNRGRSPVVLAPWAITQLKPGGVAVLPQTTAPADQYGLLPNRHIVLWPYTQIDSPHITWGDRYLLVEATMEEGALKIGFPNPSGWLAYVVAGTLFAKQAAYQPDADYFDRGSSSECYCNPQFLELETLGPCNTLAPGESVSHRETWVVRAGVSARDVPDLTGALLT